METTGHIIFFDGWLTFGTPQFLENRSHLVRLIKTGSFHSSIQLDNNSSFFGRSAALKPRSFEWAAKGNFWHKSTAV